MKRPGLEMTSWHAAVLVLEGITAVVLRTRGNALLHTIKSDIVPVFTGVNDVGFFDLINACILKLLPQVQICPEQLTVSRNPTTNAFPVPVDSYIHAVLK